METKNDNEDSLYYSDKKLKSANIVKVSTLLRQPATKIEWLVRDLIPKNTICIIGGDSGSGKTTISQLLALSIVTRTDFLKYKIEKFENESNLEVMIVDEENGLHLNTNRLRCLCNGNKFDTNSDEFEQIGLKCNKNILFTNETFGQVKFDIVRYKPKLLIIDSFVRLMGGDENSAKDVNTVYKRLKQLVEKHDLTIIILHHTVKNGGSSKHALRDSGDLSAMVDMLYMVESQGNGRFILKQEKNRLDLPSKPIMYEFISEKDKGGEVISLKIKFLGEVESEAKVKLENLCESIKRWFDENEIIDFKTADIKTQFSKNYSVNMIANALNKLIDDKAIVKIKQGYYHNIHNLIKDKTNKDVNQS